MPFYMIMMPSKIIKEITQRDDFGTTDCFGVFINGYNDGQQDFRFLHGFRNSVGLFGNRTKWGRFFLGCGLEQQNQNHQMVGL